MPTLSGTDSQGAPPGVLAAHLRIVLVDTFREPTALIGNVLIPIVCFLFFVLPNRGVVESADAATEATLQLTSMLGFSTCLFGYSMSVAQDRDTGFGLYLRTLPVGPLPRFLSVAAGTLAVTVVGVVLLWLLALVTTATSPAPSLAAGLAGLLITMVTWGLFGAALGQVVNVKTVITVAQLVFLSLAFAGGMLVSPDYMPEALDSVSTYLPSRASRDLVCSLGSGQEVSTTTVVMSIVWTLVFGVGSILATRFSQRR
ncbi:ABC transporter permease [Actinomyces wuliandei]|uniref:ABC transporter permease n=1 Tax=Actinomyces wuliandei TaxID=2057743 RepID=UPI000FD78546|nr:ABC transporter permease [Actinomyces wuliandei]